MGGGGQQGNFSNPNYDPRQSNNGGGWGNNQRPGFQSKKEILNDIYNEIKKLRKCQCPSDINDTDEYDEQQDEQNEQYDEIFDRREQKSPSNTKRHKGNKGNKSKSKRSSVKNRKIQ